MTRHMKYQSYSHHSEVQCAGHVERLYDISEINIPRDPLTDRTHRTKSKDTHTELIQ